MKILKYILVLMAVAAMSGSFVSCDRDNDITGDPIADHSKDVNGKQDYWIDLTLSNPGSLSQAAQARFVELRDTVIYGDKNIKIIEHPMYCTEDYARTNFNNVIAIPNDQSDIVQKIMLPVAKIQKVKDFEVTMTLTKDSMNTVLDSHVFRASEVLANSDLN